MNSWSPQLTCAWFSPIPLVHPCVCAQQACRHQSWKSPSWVKPLWETNRLCTQCCPSVGGFTELCGKSCTCHANGNMSDFRVAFSPYCRQCGLLVVAKKDVHSKHVDKSQSVSLWHILFCGRCSVRMIHKASHCGSVQNHISCWANSDPKHEEQKIKVLLAWTALKMMEDRSSSSCDSTIVHVRLNTGSQLSEYFFFFLHSSFI